MGAQHVLSLGFGSIGSPSVVRGLVNLLGDMAGGSSGNWRELWWGMDKKGKKGRRKAGARPFVADSSGPPVFSLHPAFPCRTRDTGCRLVTPDESWAKSGGIQCPGNATRLKLTIQIKKKTACEALLGMLVEMLLVVTLVTLELYVLENLAS
jgi:hypothetical protein